MTALLADLMTGFPASPCTRSVARSLQCTGRPEGSGHFPSAAAGGAGVSAVSSAVARAARPFMNLPFVPKETGGTLLGTAQAVKGSRAPGHIQPETRRCSVAAKVEDETVEAAAIWLQGLDYRIRDRLELVSTKARRNQDDPCVLRVRRNGFMSKLDEVDDVRGDDRPPF